MADDRPTHVVLRPKNGLGLSSSRRRDGAPGAAVDAKSELPVTIDEAPLVLLDEDRPKSRPAAKSPEAKFFEKAASKRRTVNVRRDYIIAYDGHFMGHYRAPKATAPRDALLVISQHMQEKMGAEFDLAKLSLYRPEKIRVGRAKLGAEAPQGTFQWFEDGETSPARA